MSSQFIPYRSLWGTLFQPFNIASQDSFPFLHIPLGLAHPSRGLISISGHVPPHLYSQFQLSWACHVFFTLVHRHFQFKASPKPSSAQTCPSHVRCPSASAHPQRWESSAAVVAQHWSFLTWVTAVPPPHSEASLLPAFWPTLPPGWDFWNRTVTGGLCSLQSSLSFSATTVNKV